MKAESGAGGSIDAVEYVYRQNYARFLRLAVALLGDVEAGRDAVHEAFVRALRSLEDFRGEGTLEAWIWRTLVNVCLAEKRRRPVVGESLATTWPAVGDEWPEVRTAIARLPERQRLVLFLRHYADLDYEQIGAALGMARGTVAASLHAAHARLRDVLREVTR